MYGNSALGVYPRAEGVPISGVHFARASSLLAGGEASIRSGAGGVSIGRFAWAGAGGVALNSRVSADQVCGIVVIDSGDWRRVFWDAITYTWKIREGLPVTLLSGAQGVWARLYGGGSWAERIYADPVDGKPVAGYADGLEATQWSVGLPVGPGGLSLLTTWNTPL